MSSWIEILAIVEGKTELNFIEKLLRPRLAEKEINIRATQVTKPGEKGGDVKFSRVKRDVLLHLTQRDDTFVTTFVDYYGLREWPRLEEIHQGADPRQIANLLQEAALEEICKAVPKQNAARRFLPFIAMHEFEALLFSDSAILASALGVSENDIVSVLRKCGSPEAINNSPSTAPSKRLDNWAGGKFAKTTTGIAIASQIGIAKMRERCPLFAGWLNKLECLRESHK